MERYCDHGTSIIDHHSGDLICCGCGLVLEEKLYIEQIYYNYSTKTSVWERPPDLIGRADVTEMLRSPAAAEKVKSKSVPPGFVPDPNSGDNNSGGGGGNRKSKKNKNVVDSDADDAPPAVKKKKVELVFEDEMKANEAANSSNGNMKSSIKSKPFFNSIS